MLRENRSDEERTSPSNGENQQQLQAIASTLDRNLGTLAGGERSHHCATLFPQTDVYIYIYIYLSGFVKTWLTKFQVHFNYLKSKWNGKQLKVTS